jgi:hypothetical protein
MKFLKLNRAAPRIALTLGCVGLLALHGCGGGGGSPSNPAPSGAVLSGAVVDGPVAGATVSVFALAASGVPLPSTTQLPEPLATTSSSASGAYTLPPLPATFTGPVEVTSSGGTYKDDVTGATVAGPTLSAIIPSVAAGTTTLSAQLTPLTTLAAQIAIQTAAEPGADITSLATTMNGLVADYFGGQADIVATPIVDVSSASCASAATAASTDYSTVLAGLSYLASNNPSGAQVSVIDLIGAIAQDVAPPDGVLDGYASGAPITVPTTTGGTTTLCAIEGNCLPLTASSSTLAQRVQTAVTAFAASAKNTCGVAPSGALLSALASHNAPQKFFFSIGGGFSNIFGAGLVLSIDGATPLTIDSNAPFTFPALFANGYHYDVEVMTQPPGQNCTLSSNTGAVASADVSNVSVDCELTGLAYQLSYQVSGLTGSGLILTDGFGLQAPNGNQFAAFVTDLAAGSPYAISVVTQPSNPEQTCTVGSNGTGTVSSTSITNPAQVTCTGAQATAAVYVIDSTNTLFAFDALGNKLAQVSLPFVVGNINGGGITTDANNVYVTIGATTSNFLSGGVVAYDKTTLAPVTLANGSFSQLATPRGIVYDPHNAQFYVGNGGTTVTVYDKAGTFVFSFPRGPGSDAIYGPSGIAFDATHDTIWVANLTGGNGVNPTYGVAEFQENDAVVQPPIVPATQFLAPTSPTRELPYAIGYCKGAGAGGTDLVAVGFQADNSGQGGVAEGGIYTTAGALVAAFSPQLASAAQPNAISCSAAGSIWVAANDGLHAYTAAGAPITLPLSGFKGPVAPIFGVLAAD